MNPFMDPPVSGNGRDDPDAGSTRDDWTQGDSTLDLRGEVCPFTFVRTKLFLEELPIGARVRLWVDHPPAAVNVPRSARAWGQRVVAVLARDDGTWHIDLQKLRD
jgi:tRNA 2-thiouridine synthesizing protein A